MQTPQVQILNEPQVPELHIFNPKPKPLEPETKTFSKTLNAPTSIDLKLSSLGTLPSSKTRPNHQIQNMKRTLNPLPPNPLNPKP